MTNVSIADFAIPVTFNASLSTRRVYFPICFAGHDVAKILQKELAEPVAETLVNLVFSENALEKLMTMNGIGKVNASSIINWFKENIKEYTDLCAELNIQPEKENASDKTDLSGKIFVITGTLTGYPNRKALKEEIESRGGKVAGSISSKTTYLIKMIFRLLLVKIRKQKNLVFLLSLKKPLRLFKKKGETA